MATYPIDPDVARIAKRWAGRSKAFPRLIQAVVKAEGNIVKAVQCSIPTVTTREEALEITCRSAAHAMAEYLAAHQSSGFVTHWGQTWAPRGVANDPTDLNKNWPKNVHALWQR